MNMGVQTAQKKTYFINTHKQLNRTGSALWNFNDLHGAASNKPGISMNVLPAKEGQPNIHLTTCLAVSLPAPYVFLYYKFNLPI